MAVVVERSVDIEFTWGELVVLNGLLVQLQELGEFGLVGLPAEVVPFAKSLSDKINTYHAEHEHEWEDTAHLISADV